MACESMPEGHVMAISNAVLCTVPPPLLLCTLTRWPNAVSGLLWQKWGAYTSWQQVGIDWHVASAREVEAARGIVLRFLPGHLDLLRRATPATGPAVLRQAVEYVTTGIVVSFYPLSLPPPLHLSAP